MLCRPDGLGTAPLAVMDIYLNSSECEPVLSNIKESLVYRYIIIQSGSM
jgi:hypothetical protein